MRQWEEFQPFHGIDAIEAREPVDADRLRAAAEEELAILGVGLPLASPDGRSVIYRPGRPTISVEVISFGEGDTPLTALANQASDELNRPFVPDADPLVRLWTIQALPHSYVGMTWQHWPIDGVSAADLFRRILARYIGNPLTEEPTATDLVVPDIASIFRAQHTWKRELRYFYESLFETYYFSRIYAPPRPKPDQTSLRVHLLDLQHPARPPGATVNDVVAAALVWAIAEVLPERYRNWWRRRINLINFVDLRGYAGTELQRAWGQFLAFAILHMPEPRPERWELLLEALRTEAVWIRDQATFYGSLGAFTIMRRAWPWLPRRWRWSLPYSQAPFTAGLTNTRFRAEWSGEPLGLHFGRSWRIAPLGGMSALCADMCTKGDQLSLALTFEDNSFMSERIEAIKTTLRNLLAQGLPTQ
jgi:hypothetical protein